MNTTFSQFLPEHLRRHNLPPELGETAATVVSACVQIGRLVRLGALAGVLGTAGSGNVQGEEQKKLDVLANDLLINALRQNRRWRGWPARKKTASSPAMKTAAIWCCLILWMVRPTSMSNISVGTIFSILPKPEGGLDTASFLQSGENQAAAGYVLYGPQTQLVITFKHSVYVFTLNEGGDFVLTQQEPQVPVQTKEFAINASNQRHWLPPVQQYIAELLAGETGVRSKNYNMRWVASMVAEVHRILMRGGGVYVSAG